LKTLKRRRLFAEQEEDSLWRRRRGLWNWDIYRQKKEKEIYKEELEVVSFAAVRLRRTLELGQTSDRFLTDLVCVEG